MILVCISNMLHCTMLCKILNNNITISRYNNTYTILMTIDNNFMKFDNNKWRDLNNEYTDNHIDNLKLYPPNTYCFC